MDEFICGVCGEITAYYDGCYPGELCVDCFSKSCGKANFVSIKAVDKLKDLGGLL